MLRAFGLHFLVFLLILALLKSIFENDKRLRAVLGMLTSNHAADSLCFHA